MAHGCAMCWLKAALLCIMSHCCHAALHTVLLPSYCFSTVMLLCHATIILFLQFHVALTLSDVALLLWRFAWFSTVVLLVFFMLLYFLSCCFASVMPFFLCHAALPFSCCFSLLMLLSASVSCLCHFVLPLSCFFACVVLLLKHLWFCFNNIFVLAIVGWLDLTLLVCPVIVCHSYHSVLP